LADAFPPGTANCEAGPARGLRYSFCTLVSDVSLYRDMVSSFRKNGFSEEVCEFLYVDNSTENRFDAYRGLNYMMSRASGETLVLCHQDLLAYDSMSILDQKLAELAEIDPDWGLAGNAGYSDERGHFVECISDMGGYQRRTCPLPAPVVSLDENFILVRNSVRIGPSADLEGFHMYGTDMVVQAAISGRKSYVIEFHVEHRGNGFTGPSFVRSAQAFEDKYAQVFKRRKIVTTVTKVMVGGTLIDRLYRRYRRKRRFEVPDESTDRRIKPRKLLFAVRERLHGSVYALDGHRFEIPPDSTYPMKKAFHKGEYEMPERSLVARHLPIDIDVVELGGSLGVVSHSIRRKIGNGPRHVIVEANKRLEPLLRRNIGISADSETTTIDLAAVWYGDSPTVDFLVDPDTPSNSVVTKKSDGETVSVPAKTLNRLLEENGIRGPYSLVCDIEGAEYDLLEKDRSALDNCVCMIVEIHPRPFLSSGRTIKAWLDLFRQAGFELVDAEKNVIVGIKQAQPANRT
tara:strand:- start:90052 stop:91599 length:1548 start_codon:yes stop_codon:yes gene_type:complete